MHTFELSIDEKYFNMLWRAIHAQEAALLQIIEQNDGTDEAALTSNELVYVRLCKADLKNKAAQAHFSKNAFSLSDGFIDLADLR